MKRYHLKLDDRGFLVYDFPVAGGPGRMRPVRWGMPWTQAEDQFLFRRLRELELEADPDPMRALARELQRGRLAILARFHALRAGLRLVEGAK